MALAKIGAASLVMGAAALATEGWLHGLLPGASLAVKTVRVFGAIGAGVVVLAMCARLLRIGEFDEAVRRMAGKFAPGAGRGA